MNIKELFKKIKLEDLCEELYKNHYKDNPNILEKNEKIYKQNKYSLEEIEQSTKLIIYNVIKGTIKDFLNVKIEKNDEYKDFYIFTIDSYDDLGDINNLEKYFDVFGCYLNEMIENKECLNDETWEDKINNEKYFSHYGLDFIERKYLLGCEIADICIKTYGEIKVAAELFWEMTFYGYSEESIQKEENKLKEATKEIEEGNYYSYENIDDFFKEIDSDYIPPTQEELNLSLKKSQEIVEMNLKIYNHFFKEFLKDFKD